MIVGLSQGLKQTQQMQITVQMKQALAILLAQRHELSNILEQEMNENPILEEYYSNDEFDSYSSTYDKNSENIHLGEANLEKNIIEITGSNDERGFDDFFNNFIDNFNSKDTINSEINSSEESFIFERYDMSNQSLHEYLDEQIGLERLTPYEYDCCSLIIQYINDRGFLEKSIENIAYEHNIKYLDDLTYALSIIQKCEPLGIGAQNEQGALIIQLKNKDNYPKYTEEIIIDFWQDLAKQNFKKIARHFKLSENYIKDVLKYIRKNLDPCPARQFCDKNVQIAEPDVYVYKDEKEKNIQKSWKCKTNDEGLPKIKISKQYEQELKDIIETKNTKEKDTKSFLNTKFKNAKWIMNALKERNETILKVTEEIIKEQYMFFELGVQYLKPMTLKNIANTIGLHESTISRTTSGKYLHSPRGVFELKYFFKAGLSNSQSADSSTETVKTWVAEYIKKETKNTVLSDQDIADLIGKEKKVKVARRTISKYREELGISSSVQRNKNYKSQ